MYNCTSVDEKTTIFCNKVLTHLDSIIPVTSCRMSTKDKPWMTSRIKSLIAKRQEAWKSGTIPQKLAFGSQDIKGPEMANAIKDLFLKVTQEYQPLKPTTTKSINAEQLHDVDRLLLSIEQVADKLNGLQTNKSCGSYKCAEGQLL